MSKLVTAAVGAAAIASSNAQCSAPAPLANVVIQPCGTTGASQSWNFTGTSGLGQFVLKGTSPALCMAEYGTGESGTANVAVKTCDVTDRSQLWSFYLPNQPPTWIYNGNDGMVIDVYNNEVTPGTRVDTFSPNGQANQAFTYNATQGYLVGQQSGYCLSIC